MPTSRGIVSRRRWDRGRYRAGHRRHHRFGDFCSHRHCGGGRAFRGSVHPARAGSGSDFESAAHWKHGRRADARASCRRGHRLPSHFCWWRWHAAFAGLCYAELASMIPIAGSAYTYSYATLGEIFAWIIGWDLILEYVVSNVAVAVGFSGLHQSATGSLRHRLARPLGESGVGFGALDRGVFQRSRFSDRFHPDLAAGPRREGIGRRQQRDGAGQDRRDSDFSGRRRHAGQSGQLDALCSLGIRRDRDWRRDRFLYLHRLRFGLDRGRGM